MGWYSCLMADKELTEAEKLELKQAEFKREQEERSRDLDELHRKNHPEKY